MKFERIPTRRKAVRKTVYARLFNKAKPKRQRASAAAPTADDMEEGGINISRSLTIIFAIHIVAIGMIFIHKQYLSGRTTAPESSVVAAEVETPVAVAPPARSSNLPMLSAGDKPYLVRKGDNYSIIAAKHNVAETELRALNHDTDIRAGVVLRIPKGKRIVAQVPPEVAAIRDGPKVSDSERGLVEILPPVNGDTAQLIRPNTSQNTGSANSDSAGSGRTHIVKSGENIWRISKKYEVSQKDLLSINKITDPSKLRIGQVLKLP
jgi:LysM repeat protein